jgi:hypothetical protein
MKSITSETFQQAMTLPLPTRTHTRVALACVLRRLVVDVTESLTFLLKRDQGSVLLRLQDRIMPSRYYEPQTRTKTSRTRRTLAVLYLCEVWL